VPLSRANYVRFFREKDKFIQDCAKWNERANEEQNINRAIILNRKTDLGLELAKDLFLSF
jgi:hypothetical protein